MSLRGCQKRVIVLRALESEWFEEADFIIKENQKEAPPAEKDKDKAAQRLLLSSLTERERMAREKRRLCFRFACFFALGALCAAALLLLWL